MYGTLGTAHHGARPIARRFWVGCSAASLLVVMSGCGGYPKLPPDSLPWNNELGPQPEHVIPIPTADPPAPDLPSDARERDFRDRLVGERLEELRRIAADPIIVEAVLKANHDNGQTQAEIDEADLRWRRSQGVNDPFVANFLNNPCATFLKREQQANRQYIELFVMDDKGCIVAESNKTSDYWQGDEAKWTQSYSNGEGKVFIDNVSYDRSTRSYVVQVSLPVFDERRATIGAITVSIAMPKG